MVLTSILPNAEVYIIRDYIDETNFQPKAVFDILNDQLNWQYAYNNNGRKDWTGGLDYYFSGQLHRAEPLHPLVEQIMEKINHDFGLRLNSCYANKYETGNDKISWHSDDETQIIENQPIVSLSLGASRKFWFKNLNKHKTHDFWIHDADLCIMGKDSQINYQHCIKEEKLVTEPRISLTFRAFKV